MFVSSTVFVLSARDLWDGPIPCLEESYRLWCVFECDQVKIKTLCTCCEQVGRRGKDYETKLTPLSQTQVSLSFQNAGSYFIYIDIYKYEAYKCLARCLIGWNNATV
jgi:hypothetical protein